MESEPYPAGRLYNTLFLFSPLSGNLGLELWLAIPFIIVFLIISALLSGAEVAFFSITHSDLETLQKENPARKSRVIKLLDQPHYLLSTILIFNNFVNISTVLASVWLFEGLLPQSAMPTWLRFSIIISIVTFVLALVGEIAPKLYAGNNVKSRLHLVRLMTGPLLIMRAMLYPLSWLFVRSSNFIENRMAKRVKAGQIAPVSQQEIEHAIELTMQNSKYAQEDLGLLKSIIKFGNINVKNIMKARIDVVAVEKESSFLELMSVLRSSNYSRIPVYEENFDHVIGVIHSKDLIEHFDKKENFDWSALIRPAFFVPESKKIDDLFTEFQTRRTHIAIVVDEFGGTAGIVTLEDVLEEIVGEIHDEFDEPEDRGYSRINDYTFVFDGSTSLIDVCKILQLHPAFFDDHRENVESIGGLLLNINGTLPQKNEVISFKNLTFTIVNASDRRIERVKVMLPKTAQAAS